MFVRNEDFPTGPKQSAHIDDLFSSIIDCVTSISPNEPPLSNGIKMGRAVLQLCDITICTKYLNGENMASVGVT